MDYTINKQVSIPVRSVLLKGELVVPAGAKSLVLFAHGSGSSRLSRRNRAVAGFLHEKKIGTLLFDLLTDQEDLHYYNRFDIHLLTLRLIEATEWIRIYPSTSNFTLGYFGASTGAAAALRAAALLSCVKAVVSRGGRPDLAMDLLNKVEAPTELIVGSLDYEVLEMNKTAYIQLECEKKLAVVEGATHLFEEEGTMDQVCVLAANWFERYLVAGTLESSMHINRIQ